MAEKIRKRKTEKKPDSKSKKVESPVKSTSTSSSQISQEQKKSPKLQNEKFQPFPQTPTVTEEKTTNKSERSQQIIQQYSSISSQSPKEVTSKPRSEKSSDIQTKSKKSTSEASGRLSKKVDPIKKIEDEYEDLTTLEKYIILLKYSIMR